MRVRVKRKVIQPVTVLLAINNIINGLRNFPKTVCI